MCHARIRLIKSPSSLRPVANLLRDLCTVQSAIDTFQEHPMPQVHPATTGRDSHLQPGAPIALMREVERVAGVGRW
jgi:hypothetical protein